MAAGVLAIVAIVAGGCGMGSGPSPAARNQSGQPQVIALIGGRAQNLAPATDKGAAAAAELNDFGFDLLRHMGSSGNLCASPTSIALALAMVEPGAKGQTAAEMAKVLHSFGSAGQESEILALLTSLRSKTVYFTAGGGYIQPGATPDPANPDPVLELNLANEAFLQKGMAFEQPYLDSLTSSFHSGLGTLDFASAPETARLAINKWAGDQTHGRIPSILQPGDVGTDTRLALADAIYLKAAWQIPFDKSLTTSRNFTTAEAQVVSVPTMATEQELAYASGSGYRAVDLPTVLDSMSMTIVVPDDMGAFVIGLSQAKLASILSAESKVDVELSLPRFSVDTRLDLKKALAEIGMPTAFGVSADLSGIAPIGPLNPQGLAIGAAIHQANIDVVEEGTTASAVTVAMASAAAATLATPPPPIQFHVDKPFLYLIRDRTSGAVLFLGRVDDPSK
jgi:serpin B